MTVDGWHQWQRSLPIAWQEQAETGLVLQKFRMAYPELADLSRYQVWRMGDDGNPMPIEFPTFLTDAKCMIDGLESHQHKQLYWYSDIGGEIEKR